VTHPSGNPSPLPLACTLTAGEQRSRRAWIDDLSQRLVARTQTPDGAVLRFRADADTERQLEALVAAEARCCPFLAFGVTANGDALELRVRGPAEARPIIDDLFGGSHVE
jgi:MerR family copper efflux transcriptional regulator